MNHARKIAASCVIIGATFLPGSAFAECLNQVVGEVLLPMALKNVPKNAHVVASVMTSKGILEGRASNETQGVSQVTFFLAGKELKAVSPSQLRPETRKCGRNRTGENIQERIYTALSYLRTSIISEAEARYGSQYGCNGSGAVKITLVECWTSGGESKCSYRFSQRGNTCGWAIASNAP